jgi:hypothetical protein
MPFCEKHTPARQKIFNFWLLSASLFIAVLIANQPRCKYTLPCSTVQLCSVLSRNFSSFHIWTACAPFIANNISPANASHFRCLKSACRCTLDFSKWSFCTCFRPAMHVSSVYTDTDTDRQTDRQKDREIDNITEFRVIDVRFYFMLFSLLVVTTFEIWFTHVEFKISTRTTSCFTTREVFQDITFQQQGRFHDRERVIVGGNLILDCVLIPIAKTMRELRWQINFWKLHLKRMSLQL